MPVIHSEHSFLWLIVNFLEFTKVVLSNSYDWAITWSVIRCLLSRAFMSLTLSYEGQLIAQAV